MERNGLWFVAKEEAQSRPFFQMRLCLASGEEQHVKRRDRTVMLFHCLTGRLQLRTSAGSLLVRDAAGPVMVSEMATTVASVSSQLLPVTLCSLSLTELLGSWLPSVLPHFFLIF